MSYAEHEFLAGPNDSGKRIDRVLRKLLNGLPLSGIYKALRRGDVRVNGARAQLETRLADKDRITMRMASDAGAIEAAEAITPIDRKPDNRGDTVFPRLSDVVLFENDDIVIINKPAGMPSHGPGGADEAVREYLAGNISPSLSFSPGPLHRLDRNSSGLLCLSKSIDGARRGTAAFRDHEVGKYYLAVVEGNVKNPDQWIDSLLRLKNEARTVKNDLCGKKAVTSVFPLMQASGASLCLFKIETGRTHQIRAQASIHGHPLLGDRKYGSRAKTGTYVLHCLALVFHKAEESGFPRFIEAPPPESSMLAIAASFGQGAMDEIRSALRRIFSADATLSG